MDRKDSMDGINTEFLGLDIGGNDGEENKINKEHNPARTELKDLDSLKAINLASESPQRSQERESRYYIDGHVKSAAVNVPVQQNTVQSLQKTQEGDINLSALDAYITLAQGQEKVNVHEEPLVQLQARLIEEDYKIKTLNTKLEARRIEIQYIEGKLHTKQVELIKAEARCKEYEETITATSKELEKANAQVEKLTKQKKGRDMQFRDYEEAITATSKELEKANAQVEKLTKQKKDKHVQFREYELNDGSFERKIDFIKTIRIPLEYSLWKNEYCKTTISYLQYNGKHYFAKCGTYYDLNRDFISTTAYATKAHDLFKSLGFYKDASWFKHTEPQLMALYVILYTENNKISMENFTSSHSRVSDVGNRKLEKVHIFVSREVCGECTTHMELVNTKARKFGFEFVLEDVLVQ